MSEGNSNQSFGNWLREPQTMIGISAIILSICGLFISLYEASIIREHQRASMWPHVQVAFSFQDDEIAFHVSNTGIGPARIKAANVTYKETLIAEWETVVDSAEILKNINKDELDISTFYNPINGRVLPANTRYQDIFRLDFHDKNDTSNVMINKLNKVVYDKFGKEIVNGNINITVCYCSVYDECWITSINNEETKELLSGTQRTVEGCKNVKNSNI